MGRLLGHLPRLEWLLDFPRLLWHDFAALYSSISHAYSGTSQRASRRIECSEVEGSEENSDEGKEGSEGEGKQSVEGCPRRTGRLVTPIERALEGEGKKSEEGCPCRTGRLVAREEAAKQSGRQTDKENEGRVSTKGITTRESGEECKQSIEAEGWILEYFNEVLQWW